MSSEAGRGGAGFALFRVADVERSAAAVRIGSWFIPGVGAITGLITNAVGSVQERLLDDQTLARSAVGGLADAVGVSGVWGLATGQEFLGNRTLDGMERAFGALDLIGPLAHSGKALRSIASFAKSNAAGLVRFGAMAAGGYMLLGDGAQEAEGLPGLSSLTRGIRTVRAGRALSWTSVRRQAYKAIAEDIRMSPASPFKGWFSAINVRRMERGLAPRVFAEIEVGGAVVRREISMTLHHRFLPRQAGRAAANQPWNLEIASPWAHEAMDASYFAGSKLRKIIRSLGRF